MKIIQDHQPYQVIDIPIRKWYYDRAAGRYTTTKPAYNNFSREVPVLVHFAV